MTAGTGIIAVLQEVQDLQLYYRSYSKRPWIDRRNWYHSLTSDVGLADPTTSIESAGGKEVSGPDDASGAIGAWSSCSCQTRRNFWLLLN